MKDVTLVTITGDRQKAFNLCERWMAGQSRQGWNWLVVDDGVEATNTTMGQHVIRLPPKPDASQSFKQNLMVALNSAGTDKVLFIEDDDYYAPYHVELLNACLSHRVLMVGQSRARYYNAKHKLFKHMGGTQHSSLAHMGLRGEAIRTIMLKVLTELPNPTRVDMTMWTDDRIMDKHKLLLPAPISCVGIKGLPGRSGIGLGHRSRQELLYSQFKPDDDYSKLYEWIGQDYVHYQEFYEEYDDT